MTHESTDLEEITWPDLPPGYTWGNHDSDAYGIQDIRDTNGIRWWHWYLYDGDIKSHAKINGNPRILMPAFPTKQENVNVMAAKCWLSDYE